MSGGLMQLVAIGQQDAYLTENPTITFWKRAYQRHTNFAVESIEQTFVGQIAFGQTASVTISRNGDLLNKAYIWVELPAVGSGGRYIKNVGHALINSVTMSIGGQKIDRHTGEWMHLWNRLAGKNLDGLSSMIGSTETSDKQIVYIPLHFWWNRTPGMALPLIALQYHEVKIEVNFNHFNKLVVGGVGSTNGTMAAKLFVDYVYIDNEERKRFAQANHEYLIDQVQETRESFTGTHQKKIGLNFNHPVKELVWVVKQGNAPEHTFQFGKEANDCTCLGGCCGDCGLIKFKETNKNNEIPDNFYEDGSAEEYDFKIGTGTSVAYHKIKDEYRREFNRLFRIDDNKDVTSRADGLKYTKHGASSWISEYDEEEVEIYRGSKPGDNSPANHGSNDTIKNAKISLNGHDRFTERDAKYFNLVQPYQHHSNMPGDGVYCYSFALEPESEQPSGSCNFSRIDRAELVITPENGLNGAEISVYAVNFNVLRLMGGMGGVAYAN